MFCPTHSLLEGIKLLREGEEGGGGDSAFHTWTVEKVKVASFIRQLRKDRFRAKVYSWEKGKNRCQRENLGSVGGKVWDAQ